MCEHFQPGAEALQPTLGSARRSCFPASPRGILHQPGCRTGRVGTRLPSTKWRGPFFARGGDVESQFIQQFGLVSCMHTHLPVVFRNGRRV